MTKTYSPKIGDIIIKSFINGQGTLVSRHPFIIIDVEDDMVTALDQSAIFAGYSFSGIEPKTSNDLLMQLNDYSMFAFPKNNSAKREDVFQLNSLIMFSKDVLPVDRQGSVNKEVVVQSLNVWQKLQDEGKVNINKSILPEIIQETQF